MDFGASFEVVFCLFRRFILVVWAKKQAKNGPNAARKAPPILCGAGAWPALLTGDLLRPAMHGTQLGFLTSGCSSPR